MTLHRVVARGKKKPLNRRSEVTSAPSGTTRPQLPPTAQYDRVPNAGLPSLKLRSATLRTAVSDRGANFCTRDPKRGPARSTACLAGR